MSSAAVIILNYNGVHFLEKFLPSVVAHSPGHRLIVADNASTDRSLAFLAEVYPQIEIISLDQNHGFAQGYNLALRDINNPYSILLNSDVEVTAGWIEPVLELMERDDQVMAAQPKIRSYHQPDHFEHAGAAGGYIDRLGFPFCRGRIVEQVERDTGQYDDSVPVFWASGACFFVRTEVFRQLGGFDPLFHAHMEEIDLCWRMQAAQHRILYQPRSVVYHVGGGTMPATNPRKTYLNFRNSTGMLYKNTPGRQLWQRVLLKLSLDGVAALRFVLQGKLPDAQAVLRAMLDFARQHNDWKKSRKQVAQKLGSAPTIMPHLLVVERYMKGKTSFSELSFGPKG